jgi:glycine oxidase
MSDHNDVQQVDVVIVGAGVVGASTARELALSGAQVLLIDRDERPGAGSRAAAGVGVPSVRLLGDPPMLDFAIRGRQSLSEDLARLAGPGGSLVRSCGLLRPVRNQAEADRLAGLAAARPSFLGSWVPRDELSSRAPGWSGATHGAFFDPAAAVVDAAAYTDALVAEAARAGARVRTGCELRAWSNESTHVTVELPGGSVRAEQVVFASGAWIGGLCDLPVRPLRGQMIRLEVSPEQLPRHIVSGSLYVAPSPDGRTALVGATEEDVAFAPGPTAEGVLLLLAHVARNWPGLRHNRISSIWHGFRAATPDGRPLIGRLSSAERVIVAGGHGGQGILTGGYTGRLVATLLGGESPTELDWCSPNRRAQ